jgi:hypothetical protein
MSIRDLTWATVATKLATLPPIFGGLICLSCPRVCVLLSTYYVWPTVPRKNTAMNYLFKISTFGIEVVKESSSRSRVTWFKSQSRNLFLFYLFASFTSYQLPNVNIIITYKKFLIRFSNEKILCDDFKTSTKNLDRKREKQNSSATPLCAYCVVHHLIH